MNTITNILTPGNVEEISIAADRYTGINSARITLITSTVVVDDLVYDFVDEKVMINELG